MLNYTLQDVIGTIAAFCLYPLFIFIPGYVIGYFTNVLTFQKRTPIVKVLLGLILSFVLCPVMTYFLARLSFTIVWTFYLGCALLFIGIIIMTWRRDGEKVLPEKKLLTIGSVALTVWFIVMIFSMADIQIGKRLYFSIISHDYSTRILLINAITRTGVPPLNPNYYPGASQEVSYFYFWFLLGSLVERVGSPIINARYAFMGSVLWANIALIAIIPTYLRFRSFDKSVEKQANITTRAIIGISLLGVTGLDIIPIILMNINRFKAGVPLIEDIEWWNTQVTAWVGSMLWVPHHVTGLVMCLGGWLLFRSIKETPQPKEKVIATILTGVAFASAAGTSLYVTIIFALFWGFMILWRFLVDRAVQSALWTIGSGLVALLISVPFLDEILSHGEARNVPLAFSIRPFFDVPDTANVITQVRLINLAILPFTYFIEFGFFLAAGVIYYRWRKSYYAEEVILLLVSLITCTFVKSNVMANDFGWRGLLFAQFILLIWSVDIIILLFPRIFQGRQIKSELRRSLAPVTRFMLLVLLFLGVASTIYDLVDLRVYPYLMDNGTIPVLDTISLDRQLGERTFALRQAYEYIRDNYPPTVVIQYNPIVVFNSVERYNALYGYRQVAVSDYKSTLVYGVTENSYDTLVNLVHPIFNEEVPIPSIQDICRDLNIDLLVIKDTDPNWQSKDSWVWNQKTEYSNRFVRVFRCSNLQSTILF